MSWAWANDVVDFASNAAGVLALVTFFIGLMWGRRTSREATAKTTYGNYLLKAMEFPHFSDEFPWQQNGGETSEKYEWFVSYLLNSSEAILDLYFWDRAWRDTIDSQLRYHRRYLRSDKFWFEEYSVYGRRLRKRLRVVTGLKPPATEKVKAWMAERYPNG
jgi:hypothetical protein